MSLILIALLTALSISQSEAKAPNPSMKVDVEQLVRAAERLTDAWPSQPPPPIPEVAVVARHGKPVVPLLTGLLSDDPNIERDRKRWKVQQQVSLALCDIYMRSTGCGCGRIYCDGDPPERVGLVKEGWLATIASDAAFRALPTSELLDRFKREKVFWRQFEIAQSLAVKGDRHVIGELEALLTIDDRHLRGNVAFVLGRLGDPRGFDTIAQILADRSPRAAGQGIPVAGRGDLGPRQIRADRYYAAHLLGDLEDPRSVSLLTPLLSDTDVNFIVPWSLGQIGDPRAIGPLLQVLEQDDASMRVLAIYALQTLNAREALPKLRELLKDDRRSNFGDRTTVAEAARRAIATLSRLR
jgi:hypothetical protein